MTTVEPKSVTLTKMCELHAINLPSTGALVDRFRSAFPTAAFDEAAGDWRMVWKRGTYAESNARLEAFFAENGVDVAHIDKC